MTTRDAFSAAAQWIWGGDDATDHNVWRYFRCTFAAPANIERATLLITADSAYELFIDGAFVGRGPARGLPFAYSYDVYDVTPSLRTGDNTLAVLAHYLGDHTMCYIRGAAGFLAELVLETADGEIVRIPSDNRWRTAPCAAFNAQAPRISVQLGFEEQYDANQALPGWEQAGFDDSDWAQATVIGPVGCAPWTNLSVRTIPQLTEDAMGPVSIKAVELARPGRA